MKAQGILYPASLGKQSQVRAYIASLPADVGDPIRSQRGFNNAKRLREFNQQVRDELAEEIHHAQPKILVISIAEAASRSVTSAMQNGLFTFLSEFSDDLHAVLHLAPAKVALTNQISWQFSSGRTAGLEVESTLARDNKSWWQAALDMRRPDEPEQGRFSSVQDPSPLGGTKALIQLWQSQYGTQEVRVSRFSESEDFSKNVMALFDLPQEAKVILDKVEMPPVTPALRFSRPHLGRLLQVNRQLVELEREQGPLPFMLRKRIVKSLSCDGPLLDEAYIAPLLDPISADVNISRLDADPGFDSLAALQPFLPEIREAGKKAGNPATRIDLKQSQDDARPATCANTFAFSGAAKMFLGSRGFAKAEELAKSRFAPHNQGMVKFDEATGMALLSPGLKPATTGTLIIACIKNEAPYILEWIAYHRSIGVDNFLVYSNDCEDSSQQILTHLEKLGIIYHENNDNWKGKSPQQAALNDSLKHPAAQKANWLIHIDIDEFINIRAGESGTLPELYEMMGDATNMAMTWRLFGHNGVTEFQDRPILEQFTACAPAYCPKPHTAWGFKTLMRNNGAYKRLSCHRPNKLDPAQEADICWLNGSLVDMGMDVKTKGWRSTVNTIGYDAVQLNHYALRSAESFLVKRQRGRALHVGRSVGLNYWVRMDWNSCQDVTIHRHLPRMKAELEALKADTKLAILHEAGVAWHHKKAAELHGMPEFEGLYQQAVALKLNDVERAAATLLADKDS